MERKKNGDGKWMIEGVELCYICEILSAEKRGIRGIGDLMFCDVKPGHMCGPLICKHSSL